MLGIDKIEKNSYMSGIITSMLAILVCLIAMCGSAYAYFTTTLTSGSNTIQAASFDLKVEFVGVSGSSGMTVEETGQYAYKLSCATQSVQSAVTEVMEFEEVTDEEIVTQETAIVEEPVVIEETEVIQESSASDGNYSTFKIILSNEGTATTGFAEVEIFVGEQSFKGYTHQIGANLNDRGEEDPKETREIEVVVPAGCTVEVKFTPQWGTYAGGIYVEDVFVEGTYVDESPIKIQEIFGVGPQTKETVGATAAESVEATQQEIVPLEGTIEAVPENQEGDTLTEEVPKEEVAEEPAVESEDGLELPSQQDETTPPTESEVQIIMEDDIGETQTEEVVAIDDTATE